MSTASPAHAERNSQPSPALNEIAISPATEALHRFSSTDQGLTAADAAERLAQHGPNEAAPEQHLTLFNRFVTAARNPLVILLTVLAIVAFATGDVRAGTVMLLMVILGVSLRFVQETRADAAAEKLRAMINITATVLRDGSPQEIPIRDVVPGDIVRLSAGDMIPADVRLLSSKDFFVVQASLTGESMSVEKTDAPDPRPGAAVLERLNLCFLGTSVESGSATAVVAATGPRTIFGQIAGSVQNTEVQSSFDKGVSKFTWLMIRFMVIMVPLVFLINGATKHDWREAFFFSMAVAVGLTPEMLPMIVSVSLSKGAIAMSRRKVIVKRLNAIQNFGAMDVLCTDKTGTLTADHIILEIHCDVFKQESDEVLLHAYLISHFQTGLKNVLDRAVLRHKELHANLNIDQFKKIDEVPFDFKRRMMSVVIQTPEGGHRIHTKGAPEAVFAKCSHFLSEGEVYPMEPLLVGDLLEQINELSEDGFRVLAVATRDTEPRPNYAYSKADEENLVLTGYLAFLDPPKDSAAEAIRALEKHGVHVKVLTGDNDLVTKKVCNEVGIQSGKVVLGSQVETMDDAQLAVAVEEFNVFARLAPAHKQRIVLALQNRGHVVGFMGDGINDAPALRAADVGISVDNAVDIAKESADVILLEKSLMVLEEGVIEGRKVFVNILKYIRMGASSNFGNMFSVLGASAFLPFVPMTPIQVLTNNLLYDFSQVPIPTDNVGPTATDKPRPWDMGQIGRYIVFIGPISSVFDYVTFFVMWHVFDCRTPDKAALFQTGWFVESLMTQTLIIHVIRTSLIPFVQSRASWQLTMTTIAIMVIAIILPYSPLAGALGFVPLPAIYWPILAATLLGYLLLTQIVKTWLVRKNWV